MGRKPTEKPRGRPPKRLADLPENWRERALELYKIGAADLEIIVALGITKAAFYSLFEREADFTNTVTRGREASEAWWLRQGREKLEVRDFNSNLYALHMRNRFKWGAKDGSGSEEEEITGWEVEWVEPDKPNRNRKAKANG